ncbi:hypothetical protein Q9R20_03365 [Microbacterium sp. PRF11]|uniref:hypothetical protein n=1 Tax=Microbacterium sp. PRF11 TaxID=2962593 RepID=UPI002881191A|nr:hypothetical protein [Microbacterium sp. PRF11]MDT0116019.1 hypothetical protein [Microbacterium sp. PRF11]
MQRTTRVIEPADTDGSDQDDTLSGFAPRCDACLLTAEPAGSARVAFWQCPGCALALL